MKLLAWSSAGVVAGALIVMAPQGLAVVAMGCGIFKGFYELMKNTSVQKLR